ncbi:D-alanyl-D-alanine carboxypeptidase family protein [Kineosporia succinea]|uniref:D-alanyl-D-alanine carboxypeptidase (Penicillin-binding protein 5/6) n=1 Tax=Kineosporia succinea TaxID=84632 RepID=A0ABT9P3R3_9ACTN|nr:serine hydrolase [Kineosporia succinea]MDP9827331.1 D-alanyl-D-alanine carboxypeptidase (penicillin-binding protein 5/6) [Kineosporia succinea]
MSTSHRPLRLPVVAVLATALTLIAAPAQAKEKKDDFVLPKAVSWVGGESLISTKTLTDLPSGVAAPPKVNAASWLVADLDSREILAAKNVHVPLRPASTLKLFTSLTIAPQLDAEQVYTGTHSDEAIDGTRVGIVEGSRYTVDDLLHGLIMASGNDTANALGNLAGGQASAVAQMQRKATELGAFDTVVRNTSGLDAKGQVSSAYDLALVGASALQDEQLAKIMVTQSYAFPNKGTSLTKRKHYQIQNHNRLLGYIPGIMGVKNGYTSKALGTNVSAASYQGHHYIAVVMRVKGSIYTPSGDLLKWAFKNGQKANAVGHLVEPGEVTAMTGPDIAPVSAAGEPPVSTSPSATAGPVTDGSGSSALNAALPATPLSSTTQDMIRFWPLALTGVLLLGAALFGLRPVLAANRRARNRKARGQERSRHRY